MIVKRRESSRSKNSKSISKDRNDRSEPYRHRNEDRSVESQKSKASDHSQPKGRRSDSPPKKRTINLPILIVLDDQVYDNLKRDNFNLLDKVSSNYKIDPVKFEENLKVPDLKGRVLSFTSNDLDEKFDSVEYFVERLFKSYEKNEDRSICCLKILMPENIVSLFIGSKGRQIKQLMFDTRTKIIINQPGQEASHRLVTVEGELYYVKKSIKMISTNIERLSFDKLNHSQDNRNKNYDNKTPRVVAKIVIDEETASKILNRRDNIVRNICRDNNVGIKVFEPPRHLNLKKEERVCVI